MTFEDKLKDLILSEMQAIRATGDEDASAERFAGAAVALTTATNVFVAVGARGDADKINEILEDVTHHVLEAAVSIQRASKARARKA